MASQRKFDQLYNSVQGDGIVGGIAARPPLATAGQMNTRPTALEIQFMARHPGGAQGEQLSTTNNPKATYMPLYNEASRTPKSVDYNQTFRQVQVIEQNKKYLRTLGWLLGALGLVVLFIFLALIGVYLFAALYPRNQLNNTRNVLQQELDSANTTLVNELQQINNTQTSANMQLQAALLQDLSQLNATIQAEFAGLPTIYAGPGLPAPTLGNSGSLFISTTNQSIWLKNANVWQDVFNNTGGGGGTNGNLFAGYWNASTAYQPNQIVFYTKSFYGALLANTNSLPTPSNPNWKLLMDFSNNTGPPGPSGAPGAPGSPGLGLTPRGPWNASASYVINDQVISNNTEYIALANNTGVDPLTNPSTWLVGISGNGIVTTLNASQIINGPFNPSLLPPIYVQGDVTGVGAYSPGLNEFLINTTLIHLPSNLTINPSQINGSTFNPNELPPTVVNGSAVGVGSYNNVTGQYDITILAVLVPSNLTLNASQITGGPLAPSLLPPIYLQGDVTGSGAYNAISNEYIVNTTVVLIPSNVTINASQIVGSTFNPNQLPMTFVNGSATGSGYYNNVTGQYVINIDSVTLPSNFTVNASQIVGQLPADLLPPIYLQGDVVGVGTYNAGLGEYIVNTTITSIPPNVTVNASQINGSTFNPNELPTTLVNGSASGFGSYNNVTGQYDLTILSATIPTNLTLNASQIVGGSLSPALLPPIYLQGDVLGVGSYNASLDEYVVNTTLLVIPSNLTINASQIVGLSFNPNELPTTLVNGSASGHGSYNNVTGQYDITILSVVIPSNLTINASQIFGPLPGVLLPPVYLQNDVVGVGAYDVNLGKYSINTTIVHIPLNATFNPNELPATFIAGLASGYGSYDNTTGLYNVTIASVSISSNATFNASQITNGTFAPSVLPPIHVQGDVSGVGTYDIGLVEYIINTTVVHVPFSVIFNPNGLPSTIVNGSATGYGAYNNVTGFYDVIITSIMVAGNLTLNASQIVGGLLSPSLLPPIYLQGDILGVGAYNAALNRYLVNTTLVAISSNVTVAASQISGASFNLTNSFSVALSGHALGTSIYNPLDNLYNIVVTNLDLPANFTVNSSQIINGPLSPSLLSPIYLQGSITGSGVYNTSLNEYIISTSIISIPFNVSLNASQIRGSTLNPNDLPAVIVNGSAAGYGAYNNATGEYDITFSSVSVPDNLTLNATQIVGGSLAVSLLPPIYLQGDVTGTGAYNAFVNEYIANTTITSIPPNVTINASQISGSTLDPNMLPTTIVAGNATGYGSYNNGTGEYDIIIASSIITPIYVPPTAVVFGNSASVIGFDTSRFTWNDTSYTLTTTGNSSTFSVVNDYATNGTGTMGAFLQLSTDGPSGIGTQGNSWLTSVTTAGMFLNDSLPGDIVLRNGGGRILIAGNNTTTIQMALDLYFVTFMASTSFKAAVIDQTASYGLLGQVLASTGSGIIWSSNLNVTNIRAIANVTANGFVKNGGSPSQLLVADGSLAIAGNGISINNGTITTAPLPNNIINSIMYGTPEDASIYTFPSNTTYPAPYQSVLFSPYFNPQYFAQPANSWGPPQITGLSTTIYDFSTSFIWGMVIANGTQRTVSITLQLVGLDQYNGTITQYVTGFTFFVSNDIGSDFIVYFKGVFDYTVFGADNSFIGKGYVPNTGKAWVVNQYFGRVTSTFYYVAGSYAQGFNMRLGYSFNWLISDYVNDPYNFCYYGPPHGLYHKNCYGYAISSRTTSSLFDPIQ